MATNWHKVADRLADRLMNHAHCDHKPLDRGCPFCKDVMAYEEYLNAGGTSQIEELPGKSVPVSKIRKWAPLPHDHCSCGCGAHMGCFEEEVQ